MNLKNKLEQMKGKLFLYKTFQHRIIQIKINGDQETIEIVTDKDWLIFSIMEIEGKLKDFLPISDEKATSALISLPADTSQSLAKTIIDNIDKLKDNPGYVQQAAAINKSINTLISLARAEIEARKLRG